MRTEGMPDEVVADMPLVLFGFLNGYLLALLGGGSGGAATVPTLDSAIYPTVATLAPRMTGFGSVAEFERLLDTVLAGIRARAAM